MTMVIIIIVIYVKKGYIKAKNQRNVRSVKGICMITEIMFIANVDTGRISASEQNAWIPTVNIRWLVFFYAKSGG